MSDIGSGNGLVPNRRDDAQYLCHHMVILGNELIFTSHSQIPYDVWTFKAWNLVKSFYM